REHLEYDFEIAPHRDPRTIQLHFDGAVEIRLDRDGALVLRAGTTEIRQPAPVAWQMRAGKRIPVTVGYQLDNPAEVRFHVASYDRTRALIIDPELLFENLLGSVNSGGIATGIAVDPQGNIYAAG